MADYYAKRKGKVLLMRALLEQGFTIYGYKENRSDSQSDYHSPEDWDGIAEKNGYVVVVDCHDNAYSGGKPSGRYVDDPHSVCGSCSGSGKSLEGNTNLKRNYGLNADDCMKCRGLGRAKRYETYTEPYPQYQANPERRNWHVEKDSEILVSGIGLGSWASSKEKLDRVVNKIMAVLKAFSTPAPSAPNSIGDDGGHGSVNPDRFQQSDDESDIGTLGGKIIPTQVSIKRIDGVEGFSPVVFRTFSEASSYLQRFVRRHATDLHVLYEVVYADGETFTHWYNILRGELFAIDLAKDMSDYANICAGLLKPNWMSDKAYQRRKASNSARLWIDFLNKYQIGDGPLQANGGADIVDFSVRRNQALIAKLTPEQRLKMRVVSGLLGKELVSELTSTKMTIDQLFTRVAELLESNETLAGLTDL